MKFFNIGSRPQPKPLSLSDLADRVLIAQQAYEQAKAELAADMQDAHNKLTQRLLLTNGNGTPAYTADHATEMAGELEAIAKQ